MWYYYTWHVVSQRKEVFFFFLQVCSLRQRTDGFNFTDFTDVPTTSPVTDFEPRSGWKPSFNADQLEPCSFYTIVTASFCLALAVGSKTRRLGKKKKKKEKLYPAMHVCVQASDFDPVWMSMDWSTVHHSFAPSRSVLTLLSAVISVVFALSLNSVVSASTIQ